MIESATQRLNMVESQVRPSDVVDRRVLQAMLATPREKFVPEASRSIAYMDDMIRIGGLGAGERFLLAPRVLAKLIQHLEIEDGDLVLDIGCATGYGTALLAQLAQTVVGLESDATLAEQAAAAIRETGIDNAVVVAGSLKQGHSAEGPYDAILLNGAVHEIPADLLDQLKDGGRLVAIQIDDGWGRAKQWRRLNDAYSSIWLFDAAAPILPGFEREVEFTF